MITSWKKKNHIFLLSFALILFAAGYLRLYNISYMEFKYDEAANAYLAANFVYDGVFPKTGIMSSVNIFNPPFFIYLLSFPLMFSKNPVLAAAFIAGLNILGVLLCLVFCRRFFNNRIAFIAGILFAVSPWPVMFSRKIWNQDVLTPFVVLFLLSLYKIIFEDKRRYIYLSFVSLAVLTQLHMLCAVFLIYFGVILFILGRKVSARYYGLGAGIFIFLYLPYILFEFQNNFFNLKSFYAYLKSCPLFQPQAFIYPVKLITTLGFSYFLGADYPGFIENNIHFLWLDFLMILLLAGSIIFILKHKEKKALLLLLCFGLSVIFLVFNKTALQEHYFILLYPIQYIMIAVFIDGFLTQITLKKYLLAIAVYIMIGAIVCYQAFFSISVLSYISRRTYIHGDYGTPFNYKVTALKKELDNNGKDKKIDVHKIHDKIRQGPKDDILATAYILQNIDDIK